MRRLLPPAAIVGLSLAAYLPIFTGGFVFDDHHLIESSEFIRGPLWRLWFSAAAPDYWPLTWTTLWVEWRLWGGQPEPMHAVNVALHIGAALLLWRCLEVLKVPGALLAALLFAVHPVAVDSVAQISERKNTLCAVLFFGALLAWTRFDETRRPRDWRRAFALFSAALLAKTAIALAPFVFLGVSAFRRRSITRRDVVATAPFFGVAVALGSVTVWFQHNRALEAGLLAPRSALERLGGAAWALALYIEKALVPVQLGFIYPRWSITPSSPWFFVPLAVALAAAVVAWQFRATRFALGYYALMLLPVLGFIDMAYFHLAPASNHLQYAALPGVAALVAVGLSRLPARPALAAGAVAILACSVLTHLRAEAFRDDLSLWQMAHREQPASFMATSAYAVLLVQRGERERAVHELSTFAATAPDESDRHRARAFGYLFTGRTQLIADEVIAADGFRPEPTQRVAFATELLDAGELDGAERLLLPVLREWPGQASARAVLINALRRKGRGDEAERLLRDGLELTPDHPELAKLRI